MNDEDEEKAEQTAEGITTMETNLLRKNPSYAIEGDQNKGCIHKVIMFFTRNKRLMTRRRLTTDKDGKPIGSQKV